MNRCMPDTIRSQKKFLRRFMAWAPENLELESHPDLVELKQKLEALLVP